MKTANFFRGEPRPSTTKTVYRGKAESELHSSSDICSFKPELQEHEKVVKHS